MRHYRGRFYSVPFVRHTGAHSVLLTHANLCNPTQVKQVGVTAIVILRNICICPWIISYKKLLEAPDASILWGATILWQIADPFGGASIR